MILISRCRLVGRLLVLCCCLIRNFDSVVWWVMDMIDFERLKNF